MLIALITGATLGFLMALTPGPVAVTAIRNSLSRGSTAGFLVGLGSGIVDVFFCIAVIFTTSKLISALEEISNAYPLPILIVKLAAIVGIVFYGISHMAEKENILDKDGKETPGFLKLLAGRGPFLLGIAIAAANTLSPTFLPSLGIATAWVQSLDFFPGNYSELIIFSIGFGMGTYLWIFTLVKLLMVFRHKMTDRFVFNIQRFAGITLISFGAFLTYKLVETTHWEALIAAISN